MKKFLFFIIFILAGAALGGVSSASAQSLLKYPIPELGYCRDAKECYLYCEIPKNKASCWSYGKYKLGPQVLGITTMNQEEKRLMQEKAKQYGITFPISELGNCAGPAECHDFCEQSTNYQTCIDFARKKGFAKKMERSDDGGIPQEKRQQIMQSAKKELGCTSMESCRSICEKNQARCEAFAKKYGLSQKPPSEYRQKKEEMMKKAREDLGCDSMESCRATCEKNPERCMQFAKRHGFDNRPQDEKPAIREVPSSYSKPVEPTSCRTEEECKNFCKKNPAKCPGFKEQQPQTSIYQGQPLNDSFTTPAASTQYNTTQYSNTSAPPPPAQPVP